MQLGLRLTFSTLLAALVVPACGDSGSGETTAGPTTAGPTTAGPTTAATDTPNTGTAATGTDSNPTTTPDPTSGSVSQTDGRTDTTDGRTDTTDTTGTSTTTGADEFIPCNTDKDCTLVDGCCDCDVINVMQDPPACNIPECLLTTCAGHGLENAAVECRFGRCTFTKVQCNPLGITCDDKKPECPKGQVAGVEDTNEGKCWTGDCVLAEACDWVPDCAQCEADDLVCVGKLQKGAYHVCEPRPVDCEGTDDIDCGCGQQICDASPPHTVCHDEDPDIACECPFC